MLNREKIKEWFQKEKLLLPKDTILAGFSGGSDSAALCHILAELREELGFSLELIYIQHNLREEHSRAEEVFVKTWAKKYDCPLTVVSVNVRETARTEKISLETAARKLRHQAIQQVATDKNCRWIALAHHAKDQAETVLLHFLRGSGVAGLAGMKKADGRYIRPFLDYSKADIENYITTEKIPWCEDLSNRQTIYRRNRVRLELIPYLQEHFNANIIQGLAENAKQMQDLQAYLQPQIEEAFVKAKVASTKPMEGIEIVLSVEGLQKLPTYLRQMVLRRAFAEVKGSAVDLERVHVMRAMALLEKEHGKREDLIGGWQVRKCYENLIFEPKTEKRAERAKNRGIAEDEYFALGLDRIHRNRYIKIIKEFILIGRIYEKTERKERAIAQSAIFDRETLPRDVVFRYPQPEDYLIINAAGNTKKLKDFLADRKVPKEKRSRVPVAAAGSEIIWVIGERIGYPYRVTETTKQVLRLTILGRTGKCQKLKNEFQKRK